MKSSSIVGTALMKHAREVVSYAFDAAPAVPTPNNLTSQQQTDLARHDQIYHGGKYTGGRCKYRDNLNLGKTPSEYDDEIDFLEDATNSLNDVIGEANKLRADNNYQVDATKLDLLNYYKPTVRSIATRGDALASKIQKKIDKIDKWQKKGVSYLNNRKHGDIKQLKFDPLLWKNPNPQAQPKRDDPMAKSSSWSAVPKQTKAGMTLQDRERNLIQSNQDLKLMSSGASQALKQILDKMIAANDKELSDVQSQITNGNSTVIQS